MKFLVDENLHRKLAAEIRALEHEAEDVRDIGLQGHSDEEIYEAAADADAIIITRDRGFTEVRNWPGSFTAGVIFINLPETIHADTVKAKVLDLIKSRLPESLLGAVTKIEMRRALSRTVRRR